MTSLFIGRLRFFLFAFLTVLAGSLSAHIKNEASQFPDIEFSDAQFEIVLLVGAGVIPETPVFEPDISLSKTELAAWAALASGLSEGGETPDISALAEQAQEEGLLESLEGDATYDDVSNVLFQGQVSPEQPAAVPTKAEAAEFIAANLETGVNGQTLLDRRGMRVGPVGEVTAVESKMNPDGGSSYYVTIAGETYSLYSHGRVANGPTDLIQWQGRAVRRSFLKQVGDYTLWVYLEAEPRQASTQATTGTTAAMADAATQEPRVTINHNLLYGLIIAVLVLGVILFFRGKRS